MATTAAPLVLGGLALFLLGRRDGDEDETPEPEVDPTEKIPEGFSCEDLVGIWHEPTEGNLPMTIAAYGVAHEYFLEALSQPGVGEGRQELVLEVLDQMASGCHWEDQLQYSARMTDLYNAMLKVHQNVVNELREGEG